MNINHLIFKTFCLTICLLAATYLNGQTAELISNKHITYLNTFTMDYSFDPLKDQFGDSQFRKLNLNSSQSDGFYLQNWLILEIVENAKVGVYDCFEDSDLKLSLSSDQILEKFIKRDTVLPFDISSYEESINIVESQIPPSNYVGLRCKQLFYYNQKEKQYYTQLLAIAPLVKDTDTDIEELIWIKMDTPKPKNMGLSSKDVLWSVMTSGRSTDLLSSYMPSKALKGNEDVLLNSFFDKLKAPNVLLEKDFYGSNEFFQSDEDPMLGSDTIVAFDPIMYAEVIKVVPNEKVPDHFNLVQDWYYNSKDKQLYNKLKAIAPVKTLYYIDNRVLYKRSLFFLRTEE